MRARGVNAPDEAREIVGGERPVLELHEALAAVDVAVTGVDEHELDLVAVSLRRGRARRERDDLLLDGPPGRSAVRSVGEEPRGVSVEAREELDVGGRARRSKERAVLRAVVVGVAELGTAEIDAPVVGDDEHEADRRLRRANARETVSAGCGLVVRGRSGCLFLPGP